MTEPAPLNRWASTFLALTLFLFGLMILGCGAAALAFLFGYQVGLMQKLFQIFFGIFFIWGGGFVSYRSIQWFRMTITRKVR